MLQKKSYNRITLRGKNLGERHHYLNTLVCNAYKVNEPLEPILSSPASGPVDRLFKIELASKHRHVHYILDNLRDDDMLYVSRALKAKWLLENAYRHIMNPNYLENDLYPNMITPAVNKTKHWIHLNLRDPTRCQEFYEFYSDKDKNIAIKFLSKCSPEIVEKDCPKWFGDMTPKYFKILCEKNAIVAKLFLESLKEQKPLKEKCIEHKDKFIKGLQSILKSDVDIYLDLVEQMDWKFPRVSSTATKYIMKERKDRFLQKSELYAVNILHMETLAQCLSPEECEDLVLKLARAKFLENNNVLKGWFCYENVEALIKRLNFTKRDAFKKRVFLDKDVGKEVADWPYPITHWNDNQIGDYNASNNIFDDNELQPEHYENIILTLDDRLDMVEQSMYRISDKMMFAVKIIPKHYTDKCLKIKTQTPLQKLFDYYRFMTFDETMLELRKKLVAESNPKKRMCLFLILVSKTGGKMVNLCKLMELMMYHRNEPAHVRAAVVRSLVKRTSIWRAADDIWESLLMFAEGLGLDGAKADCECIEGLHAVVIRSLLANKECEAAIKTAFLNNFSTITNEYALTFDERDILFHNLYKVLLHSERRASDPYEESYVLMYLLDTIEDYKRNVDQELLTKIKAFAAKHNKAAKPILYRLFSSRIGRKELFDENFALMHTADTYMNALKHKTDVLSPEHFVNLVRFEGFNAGHFLRKINIYFGENKGLRDRFLSTIKKTISDKYNITKMARALASHIGDNFKFAGNILRKMNIYFPKNREIRDQFSIKGAKADLTKMKLARPLVYLMGNDLKSYISKLDAETSKESKLFAAQVRGHAHVARPALSVDSTEWRQLGAKHVANRALVCRQADVDNVIKQLLMWRRTAKLAVILSKRMNCEVETLAVVAKMRPNVALKSGLSYIQRQGNKYDSQVWELIKPLMMEVSKKSVDTSHSLRRYLKDFSKIPLKLKPEFVTVAFNIFKKFDDEKSLLPTLCQVKLGLPDIDEAVVENILLEYLNKDLVFDKIPNLTNTNGNDYITVALLHLRILGKFLLLCETEASQTHRFEKVGLLYLNRLETFWNLKKNKKLILNFVDNILQALKFTEVFLNNKYVDSVPLMEMVKTWMQSILPMEQYFNLYVDLHLTMSYCRAVRQSMKRAPEVFSNNKRRLDECVKIVGENFGKRICEEAHKMKIEYFDSVMELYSSHLIEYLPKYFNSGRLLLVPHIMRGFLASARDVECFIAISLFNHYNNSLTKTDIHEICGLVKQRNDIVSQFMYHCVMT